VSTMREMYQDIKNFYCSVRPCYPKWSAKELKRQMERKLYADSLMTLEDALDEEYRCEFGVEPKDVSRP